MHDWAVIGAGPAGIAAVGKLIDLGVPSQQILWVDPCFTVGDFGTLWRNVPSNTKVKLFLKFLQAANSFQFDTSNKTFTINEVNPEDNCQLHLMADALQWVSNHLQKKVVVYQDHAQAIWLENRTWQIKLTNNEIAAHKVILAIGATPKVLSYAALPTIPLEDAMDKNRIQSHLRQDEKIAVFGASHSAILVLRNLVEQGVKQIINFYRSPLRYAVYLDDWILFDDSGLKGSTADWARDNIDGVLPKNLVRLYANEENIEQHLPTCTKAVYAVGFDKRMLPIIENFGHLNYIEQCGIIAPGLFGFGIAFPEAKYNPYGLLEYRVGLWKFMDYLQRILPVWMKYSA